MSSKNYPPKEVINPSSLGKKNYEHIILWMLFNNDECEWSDFLQKPLEIPTSTLSRYLTNLKIEGHLIKLSKGHYKITPEGKNRFHDISRRKVKHRKLNFPPNIILKSERNYEHWVLWMVYNNSFCKWADFLGKPLSINQSSLSKVLKLMIKNELIKKDEDSKEYSITQLGKFEYSKMLEYYDLDKQTILEQESERIGKLTKKTIQFFEKYKIEQKSIQFRFLNNVLKLNYDRVKSILKNEEDYYKILLFLSINHPFRYPEFISAKSFSRKYNIKENTLTYYIDEIVDNEIYPVKFFKLTLKSAKKFYFQENEKLETMIRAISESHIKEVTYLNKLYGQSKSINIIIDDIIKEICSSLLNIGLKEPLKAFLPDYIDYLAYKIEVEAELKESYDKLEGIIWQNMTNIFQTKKTDNLERQYKEELEEIEKELETGSTNIDLYYSKIKILIFFGKYDELLNLIDKMLEMFPKDEIEIKLKKASIFKRIKQLEKGLEIIEELIDRYPENRDLPIYKAYWLQYLNRKEESIKLLNQLIEKDPDNGTYYDAYGEILMYFEMYDDAVEKFQKALNFIADEWFVNQTYIKLGICYKELGNHKLAIEYLRKGKKLTNTASISVGLKSKWLKIVNIFIDELESW